MRGVPRGVKFGFRDSTIVFTSTSFGKNFKPLP